MSGFPVPGGSCLVCYDLPATNGYVRGFHKDPVLITQQLQAMFQNGQRRLSISIPYYDGGDLFALDSTNGQLTSQDKANITALVQAAQQIGFGEFVVEMIPEATSAYTNWTGWQPQIYNENLEFTLAVAKCMDSTGVFYHMDLLAECDHIEHGRRLWMDWCAVRGGPDNSLGFSMVPIQTSIDNYAKVYSNGVEPTALSVHCYGGPGELSWDQWKAATSSWSQGYVVGESLCNSQVADKVFDGSPDRLFYRFVWPITANNLGPGVTQDCLTIQQKF